MINNVDFGKAAELDKNDQRQNILTQFNIGLILNGV